MGKLVHRKYNFSMHIIPGICRFGLPFLINCCAYDQLIAQKSILPKHISTNEVEVWLTTKDGGKKLSKEPSIWFSKQFGKDTTIPYITVMPSASFQTMDGMGSSLEPATCFNLSQLSAADRVKTLNSIISPDLGIGMNLMRICMGTPDFTGDTWYSYCDLPKGETDTALLHFSIEKDKKYIIPIIKEALHINPKLVLFASPWSPPGWMKTSGTMIGGKLKAAFYAAYAMYFVKFLQAYATEGIPIAAVTIQNEPGVDRMNDLPKWWYPSCHWTAEEQKDFIKNNLGPLFKEKSIHTEIWCYDHNYNIVPITDGSPVFLPEKPGDAGISFPKTILADPEAKKFTNAVAFHGYAGDPTGMAVLQQAFPKIPIRFTEGSIFGLEGSVNLIQILKNYAVSYNAWVMMLDDKRKPNNGAFTASQTIIERNSQTNQVSYNLDYYLYGHFMKFIQKGAVRIATEGTKKLAHIAFRDEKNHYTMIVVNQQSQRQKLGIRIPGRETYLSIPAESIVTLKW